MIKKLCENVVQFRTRYKEGKMTASIPKIAFHQLPPALKFVVVWLGFICIFRAVDFILETKTFISEIPLNTSHIWDIGGLISSYILFLLLNGLINKTNSARIWTAIFTGLGVLASVIFLGRVLFMLQRHPSASIGYEIFNYDIPMTLFQFVGFNVFWIVINLIALYILVRPSTKALFTPPPPREPSPQETA